MKEVLIWVVGGLRHIFYFFDSVIYSFIIDLYDIFRWICGARIVDNQVIGELSSRIGFVLGLIMFFYITFDFVQILLDPDKLTDKDKGPLNIVKKFLIVIVLLGTSTYIFDLMYSFQSIVLSNDDGSGSILEKLILPYSVNVSNFGNAIAKNFMVGFYKVSEDIDYEINDLGDVTFPEGVTNEQMDNYSFEQCIYYTHFLYTTIENQGSFEIGNECLLEQYKVSTVIPNSGDVKKWFIDFNMLSLPIGLYVAWILITYCVSVGMRVVQLVVLQIISPAAIICYLSPSKENVFTKWLKLYFATYIDVFIRISIINFIILLCGLIFDTNSLVSDYSVNSKLFFWIDLFMILALLSFAKKFPEFLKKMLPESISGLSLGFGAKDKAGLGWFGTATAAGIGGIIGASTGAVGGAAGGKGFGKVTGFIGGLFGGATRGLFAGGKAKNLREAISGANKAQADVNKIRAQRIASGTTWGERAGDALGGIFGIQTSYSGVSDVLSSVTAYQDAIEGAPSSKRLDEQYKKANELRADKVMELKQQLNAGTITDDQYRAQVDAIDATIAEIKAQRNQMFEAVRALSTGDLDKLSELSYVHQDGNDYYINGVKVANMQSLPGLKASAERSSRKRFASYDELDTEKNRLIAEQASRHKGGN